jgi:hypothetical protein
MWHTCTQRFAFYVSSEGGLEPTTYRTQGEHANDYTTDVNLWHISQRIHIVYINDNQ